MGSTSTRRLAIASKEKMKKVYSGGVDNEGGPLFPITKTTKKKVYFGTNGGNIVVTNGVFQYDH